MMRRKRYRTKACEAGVCSFYLDEPYGYKESWSHPCVLRSISGLFYTLPRHYLSLSGRHRVIQSHTLRFR